MNIQFNEEEQSLEIKDHARGQYLLLKGLAIANILNAFIQLVLVRENGFGFFDIIWLILGVLSCAALYFFIYKKTTQSKIWIKDIKDFNHKSVWGNSRFSIVLRNGKQRDLLDISTKSEFDVLKLKLKNFGVAL